jgi:hypothetical protein
MSSRRLLVGDQSVEGALFVRFVGQIVLPAVPDDEQLGAGEDVDGMGVVVSAGDGSAVEVGHATFARLRPPKHRREEHARKHSTRCR